MNAEEIVTALRPRLADALVAVDFDGTLAPLVPDPTTSRPVDGARAALTALARRGAQVAVITGRDADTVLRLGRFADVPGIVVAGVYGVETWRDGALETPPTPPQIERLRTDLPAALDGADPAVWVEDKRLSLVVHTRRAADPSAERDRLAPAVRVVGERLGLDVHLGSDVVELRLPGYDKAGALGRLAAGRDPVLYLGDDLGDLPAFAEIRRMRARGVTAYGVGVLSSGVDEVPGAADVTVENPHAVVELLRSLAG